MEQEVADEEVDEEILFLKDQQHDTHIQGNKKWFEEEQLQRQEIVVLS